MNQEGYYILSINGGFSSIQRAFYQVGELLKPSDLELRLGTSPRGIGLSPLTGQVTGFPTEGETS
jgi:hypothetical protein